MTVPPSSWADRPWSLMSFRERTVRTLKEFERRAVWPAHVAKAQPSSFTGLDRLQLSDGVPPHGTEPRKQCVQIGDVEGHVYGTNVARAWLQNLAVVRGPVFQKLNEVTGPFHHRQTHGCGFHTDQFLQQ